MADIEKLYRVRELHELSGYPLNQIEELARKIGRKSNPDAERGFHYLLKISEVKKHFTY